MPVPIHPARVQQPSALIPHSPIPAWPLRNSGTLFRPFLSSKHAIRPEQAMARYAPESSSTRRGAAQNDPRAAQEQGSNVGAVFGLGAGLTGEFWSSELRSNFGVLEIYEKQENRTGLLEWVRGGAERAARTCCLGGSRSATSPAGESGGGRGRACGNGFPKTTELRQRWLFVASPP